MADFHFIRPWWLLALALVLVVVYLLKRLQVSNSGWQQVIPKHLANKLIDGTQKQRGYTLFIPCLITTLAVIALAGPAWQKLPQPVYNVQKGAVIVMDMSNSMYSTDLSPNRLTRARYKAIDLLEKLNEGDTGLISYAGDSFIISPLTEDINNIKLLLPALSPQLMPVQGSNPLLALTMANDMLINAGHLEGDIYWFTDDVDQYDVEEIDDLTAKFNHRVNILGVGSKTAAPIKMPNGQLLKDDTGAIVIPHLTEGALQGIASKARGTYQTISNNSSDIETLVSNAIKKAELKEEETQFADGDQFKEAGPYILLLILPLLLGYFRRGNLLALLPCLIFFSDVPTSYAQESVVKSDTPVKTNGTSVWTDLWQTQDQQAQQKYNNEQFDEAAQQFKDAMWQGIAHYKNGDYEQALQAFKNSDNAESHYNQGNSLAKLQKFDEAIKAYNTALEKNPDLEAAKANKALVEQIKEHQEQQKQEGDGESSDENQNEQQDQENSEQQSNENQDQSEQGEQDQSQDQPSESESEEDQSQANQDQQSQDENEQQDCSSENSEKSTEENDEQEENTDEQTAQGEPNEEESDEEQVAQQLTEAEQAAEEEDQKHQQLLKKVTDDPYLLLRNKMKLEYQKRRNQNSGVNKKW